MGLLGYTVYKDLKTYDSCLSGHGVVNHYSDEESWEHACTLVDETALTNAARLTIITFDPQVLNYDEAKLLE
jgi:hypothetical protein